LPINGHVTDFVVLLYTFIFIFLFFNYFVVLPVMMNKDFQYKARRRNCASVF